MLTGIFRAALGFTSVFTLAGCATIHAERVIDASPQEVDRCGELRGEAQSAGRHIRDFHPGHLTNASAVDDRVQASTT